MKHMYSDQRGDKYHNLIEAAGTSMPKTTISYEAAFKKLHQPTYLGRTAFQPARVGILRRLCEKHQIVPSSTGKRGAVKEDYINALLEFRMRRGYDPAVVAIDRHPATENSGGAVDTQRETGTHEGSTTGKRKSDSCDHEERPRKRHQICAPVSTLKRKADEPGDQSPPKRHQGKKGNSDVESSQNADPHTSNVVPAMAGNVKRSKGKKGTKTPKLLWLKFYRTKFDWHHFHECSWKPCDNGDINLKAVKHQLLQMGERCGRIRAIDPKTGQPFRQYVPDLLHADDVELFIVDGCLRILVEDR
ncbi:hypothetical protein BD410DRAFT_843522 [Rickenella mellea]|uniref:Uncharacterized protein n=1 Tax=Rickenella mellea TaxID=50990 RepID=A0A4Y7PSV4_9AGAM|nr:hypothetical protein BD410DRAFT_843522 [Rickenella mellea]